ncbi:hypothetical protein VE04_08525 [Pseudogymnoascus sp. 24MN13]|nr:hypothetical protein VE04_08525 [Pseudogymnoascus sp. 24MN13]
MGTTSGNRAPASKRCIFSDRLMAPPPRTPSMRWVLDDSIIGMAILALHLPVSQAARGESPVDIPVVSAPALALGGVKPSSGMLVLVDFIAIGSLKSGKIERSVQEGKVDFLSAWIARWQEKASAN